MSYYFANRIDAAHRLALELKQHTFKNPIMLALPRGGVPIAHEISLQLKIPWEILVVRKIGAPGYREYGIGALAEDGIPFIQDRSYDPDLVNEVIAEERQELARRINLFRGGAPLPDLTGRDVILIDDGLATGVTAIAASRYLKHIGAHRIIVAVPVGPSEENPNLTKYADEIICLQRPHNFYGVGNWYMDFGQVSDEEVMLLHHRIPHAQIRPTKSG